MQDVFLAINQMVADGIIADYAIGGAIGAAFYIEAKATNDVDIFVHISPAPPMFMEMSEIYKYAESKGYKTHHEYIVIGDWDVQFLLPAEGTLEDDAVKTANVVVAFGVEIRVMMPEYLCAIALDTKRAKDFDRVRAFVKEKKVNLNDLGALVSKFQLEEQWKKVMDPA